MAAYSTDDDDLPEGFEGGTVDAAEGDGRRILPFHNYGYILYEVKWDFFV